MTLEEIEQVLNLLDVISVTGYHNITCLKQAMDILAKAGTEEHKRIDEKKEKTV